GCPLAADAGMAPPQRSSLHKAREACAWQRARRNRRYTSALESSERAGLSEPDARTTRVTSASGLAHGSRDPARLSEEEEYMLTFIRQEPTVERAYRLAQHFTQMMHEHQSAELDQWISTCT